MFDLVAIALFQIAIMLGYTPEQPNASANNTTASSTTAPQGGSGGWGHDVQSNTPPPANLDGGSGGWGHD